ncbi:non-structural maintenance of chromosomes element 1 homolog [Orussus abietinus]|uniref:non-structural maintenance of chromosomes element 1 homolog n=1 Tax=Orussus abietinus TaxID=222816 RepID=UPI0006264A28|nr:non-structural maintenance of chromosomes element 1 homolog [Orussus abietinus]
MGDYRYCKLFQAVIDRGTMSDQEARELIIKIFESNRPTQTYITEINKELQRLSLVIKSANCEHTGEKYWILTNAVQDDMTRYQMELPANQLELIKKVLHKIVTSPDSCASSIDCLNFCPSLKQSMSKHDGDAFLKDMIAQRWLFSKEGSYYIGVRSIVELITYLKTLNDGPLNTCCLCRQIIFYGKRCNNCETIMHQFCLADYEKVQGSLKCPNCSQRMGDANTSGTHADK